MLAKSNYLNTLNRYECSLGEDSHHGGGSALDMGPGGGDHDQNRTELTKLEIELCKQNFGFYDHRKVGSVERFELPMLLNGKQISCLSTPT